MMADCSASTSSLFAFVGWLITGVGWFVTSRQANIRESRKDLRAKIDSLIQSIESVQDIAQDYYANKGEIRDRNRLKLFPHFEKIETKTSLLAKYEKDFNVDIAFSAFWEAITDGNFDSVELDKLEVHDERFARISSAGCTFVKCIENWYIQSN